MKIDKNDFEISIVGFDKEKITEEINENILKNGYELNISIEKFDFSLEEEKTNVEENLFKLHYIWNIELEKPTLSTSGIKGKIKTFFKKAIRKMVRPYVKPIFEEQVIFNEKIVEILDYYNEKIEILEKEIEILKKEKTL